MALPANITPKMVQDMFLNIAKGYPYHPCRQIETFAVIDKLEDLEADNLGMVYGNYLDGSYWGRQWEKRGAKEDEICKAYPLFSIETKFAFKEDICRNELCFDTWLVVADVPDCEECKDECKRTIAELDRDLFTIMNTILTEMKNYVYVYCQIEGVSNPDIVGWFTQIEAAQIEQNNDCVTFQSCQTLCQSVVLSKQGRTDLAIADLANSDGARAVTAKLTFCGCTVTEEEQFDYTDITTKPAGTSKCETC